MPFVAQESVFNVEKSCVIDLKQFRVGDQLEAYDFDFDCVNILQEILTVIGMSLIC